MLVNDWLYAYEAIHIALLASQLAAGRVAMEIELVEDAYLARQLLPVSSKMLPVGTPIGLLCENESDTKEVAQHKLPADFNEYSNEYVGQYRIASWQSYLKERKVEPSSGCM